MNKEDTLKLIEQANDKMKKNLNADFIHGFSPISNFGNEKTFDEVYFSLSPTFDFSIDSIKEFQSLIQEKLPKAVIVVTRKAGQQTFVIKMY